jgi:hypothetical protein
MNRSEQLIKGTSGTVTPTSKPSIGGECATAAGRALADIEAQKLLTDANAGVSALKERFINFDTSELPKIHTVKDLKRALENIRGQHGELRGVFADLGGIIPAATSQKVIAELADAAINFNKGDSFRFSQVITEEVRIARREKLDRSLSDNIGKFENTLRQNKISDAAIQSVVVSIRPNLEKILSPLRMDPINGRIDPSEILSAQDLIDRSVANKVKLKVPGESEGLLITAEIGEQLSRLVSNLGSDAGKVFAPSTREMILSGSGVKAVIATDDLGRGTIQFRQFRHGNSQLTFELKDGSGDVHQRLNLVKELGHYLNLFDVPNGTGLAKHEWKDGNAAHTIGLMDRLGIRSEIEWRPVRPQGVPGSVRVEEVNTTKRDRALAILAGTDSFSLHSVNSPFGISFRTEQGGYKIELDKKLGINSFAQIYTVEGEVRYLGSDDARQAMIDSLTKSLEESSTETTKCSEIPVLGELFNIPGARLTSLARLEIDRDMMIRCSDRGCDISLISVTSGCKIGFKGTGIIRLEDVTCESGSLVSVQSANGLTSIENSRFDILRVPNGSILRYSEAKQLTGSSSWEKFESRNVETQGCEVRRRLLGLFGVGAPHSLVCSNSRLTKE